jgi:hypothetical protein
MEGSVDTYKMPRFARLNMDIRTEGVTFGPKTDTITVLYSLSFEEARQGKYSAFFIKERLDTAHWYWYHLLPLLS